MERIRSIQELRMQKELMQLQQMIAELRMKKDVETIRRSFRIKDNLVPLATSLVESGIKNNVVRGVFQIATSKLGKMLKRRKKRNKDGTARK